MKPNPGDRFSRWTIVSVVSIKRLDGRGTRTRFLCLCDCGKKKSVLSETILSGHSKSCGCLKSEILSQRMVSHRMTGSSEHNIWSKMKNRCNNPKGNRFHDYGGRGIKVCWRWNKFENFFSDMGPRPSPLHSIDRINNDKGYSPENCKWSTSKEQSNNRRDNRFLMHDGEKITVSNLARKLGINTHCFRARIKRGWSLERACATV